MQTTLKINNFKPSVNKSILILSAGILWFGVGIMLCSFTYKWLSAYKGNNVYLFIIAGVFFSFLFARFKFKKFALKNIKRIYMKDGKSCFFSFMSWQTYIIVAFMMTMGIMLRHSEIPKQYLSIFYIGIGGALSLSSFVYFNFFFNLNKRNSN